MSRLSFYLAAPRSCLLLATVLLPLSGCGSLSTTAKVVTAGTVGSLTPGSDLEQTYYLGSFDPRSQLPPAIFRIRVRGQSSVLSSVRFGSSWVPAEVVDSLAGEIDPGFGRSNVKITNDPNYRSPFRAEDRKLVLFGPEGFRQAPKNHRLVVIMGSNPDAVEQAFSSALGTVAAVKFGESGSALERQSLKLLLELGREKERLSSIVKEP